MLRSYLPALVFVLLGAGIGTLFAFANRMLGTKRRVPHKADPYECGLPSEVKHNFKFGISFYLIAMLFILFDLEVVFLFPVALQLASFGTFALIEIGVFITLLAVAFVYVWRRGALSWT
ncbi:NADH-quinone oxidoreductase subunit A [Svornostia abyssi]|uniref:NADH-quinone oxidoreductase subunit A n=1 Tax=Svornostia abyssi TaxID=2898438 RepID=A0ABY5PMC3_9ACTN|nr:NADH-quinone oxidoreductase subunit A [Parviterribacteraceae bacterium J379]